MIKTRTRSPAAALPGFVPPCLATTCKVPPSGPRWVHEIELDGYRLQARIDKGNVQLLTRRGLESSPFAEPLDTTQRRGVQWVRPELAAEVGYRAWTGDGLLRHASFIGLREDKPAREVGRPTRRGGGGTGRSHRALPSDQHWDRAISSRDGTCSGDNARCPSPSGRRRCRASTRSGSASRRSR